MNKWNIPEDKVHRSAARPHELNAVRCEHLHRLIECVRHLADYERSRPEVLRPICGNELLDLAWLGVPAEVGRKRLAGALECSDPIWGFLALLLDEPLNKHLKRVTAGVVNCREYFEGLAGDIIPSAGVQLTGVW